MKSKFHQNFKNMHGTEIPALNVDGVKIINDIHGLENTFVCDGDEAFGKAMQVIADDKETKDFDLMLIRKFERGHFQPIKIERRNGQDNIIIMDSTGDYTSPTRTPGNFSKDTIDKIRLKIPVCNIYNLVTRIQKSDYGCDAFTVKFIKKMYESKDLHIELQSHRIDGAKSETGDFFSGLFGSKSQKQEVAFRPEGAVIECRAPERFAVFLQSREDVKEYMGSRNFKRGRIFTNKQGEKVSFEEKIYKQRNLSYSDSKGLIPSVIYYFAKKYARQVDVRAREVGEAGVETILTKHDSEQLTSERLKEVSRGFVESPSSTMKIVGVAAIKDTKNVQEASCITM